MVELTYLDSYKVKRTLTYEDFDEFLLAFSGCVTVPDSLKVLSITYNGHQLPFTGLIAYAPVNTPVFSLESSVRSKSDFVETAAI